MEQSLRVRVSGPLAGCASELVSCLAKRGYTDHSVTNHVRRLACLSRWMEAGALDRAGVDEALIAKMLEALHASGEARSFTTCSFGLVLGFLRGRGLVPDAPIVPPTPMEARRVHADRDPALAAGGDAHVVADEKRRGHRHPHLTEIGLRRRRSCMRWRDHRRGPLRHRCERAGTVGYVSAGNALRSSARRRGYS